MLFLSDPYLNTDPGTMSPFEHGEVFVLDDGGEVKKSPPFILLMCLFLTTYTTSILVPEQEIFDHFSC